ncbi:hypothetical protein Tco_0295258 [Tanacetum coccineum]
MSPVVPVPQPEKKADLSTDQLLLIIMDEVKSLKEKKSKFLQITLLLYHKLGVQSLPKANKPHGLDLLKGQSYVNPSAAKAPMIPKPFKECKYCGFNDHHSDNCEYYPGCEVCGSIAHEPADYPKRQ